MSRNYRLGIFRPSALASEIGQRGEPNGGGRPADPAGPTPGGGGSQTTRRLMVALTSLPRPWLAGYRATGLPTKQLTLIRQADRDTLQALLVEVICELERRTGGGSAGHSP